LVVIVAFCLGEVLPGNRSTINKEPVILNGVKNLIQAKYEILRLAFGGLRMTHKESYRLASSQSLYTCHAVGHGVFCISALRGTRSTPGLEFLAERFH
jgi:hypothetical protein